jgi:hypothetical protein
MLPASDVVMVIDHSRIWNEAIPRIFGADSAPLAKIMAEAETFKAKTGIDVRSISRIAVGLRFVNPEGITKGMDKKDFALVIIAQGDFESARFIDAMRREVKDKIVEETYKGQLLYQIDERPKGSTQPKPETETPCVAALDANTIALGDLAQMRATVDAREGGNRLSADLLALATRNSNALLSLAGNVPVGLMSSFTSTPQTGSDEMDKTYGKFLEAVASIQQVYMSAGMTASGIETFLGARFSDTEHAQSLGDMLLGARQQYGVFIEDKMIRELVDSIQITAQGDEVQLRQELPLTLITAMLNKSKKAEATTAATATAPKTATAKATAKTTATPARKKTRRTTARRKKG